MEDFLLSKEEVIKKYNSNEKLGLMSIEAKIRQEKYGYNIISKKKKESIIKKILDSTKEPLIIMLLIAWLLAMFINIFRWITKNDADFLECVGIFVAIFISVSISVVMESKSMKAFDTLNNITNNINVEVIRDGNVILTNKKDVVIGDVILLNPGCKLVADGRIIKSESLMIDESSLTGETNYIKKTINKIDNTNTPLAERNNMAYAGTYVKSGYGKMVVTCIGNNTEFGKIANELLNINKNSTPLQDKLKKLGKNITFFGIIAAFIVFISQIISLVINKNFNIENILDSLVTSVVLIVAAVPEGLPTIVALSLSINIIKLAKNNALVKKLVASETVGCINVICSDKTGTLTENKMKVINYYTNNLYSDIKHLNNDFIKYNICINSTGFLSENNEFIGNPTECAMLKYYQEGNFDTDYKALRKSIEIINVTPFSSDLKYMSTLCNIDDKRILLVKGSPEIILNNSILSNDEKVKINKIIQQEQDKAMRVIGFGHYIANNDFNKPITNELIFDGFVSIADPLRNDVLESIKLTKKANIELKILTGDNINTAKAIANSLGILKDKIAVEGNYIDSLNDEELKKQINNISVIARSTPSIKLRVVRILMELKNVVAVTGDGINDAPALNYADVGIAMGISGTDVSKDASDIVLLNDSFSTIVKAIEWGRNIYENFKRFISFQLTVNLASVIVVFISIIVGFNAPFTALELLWINIIMDGPPALTLGLEPNHSNLMDKKPTKRNENIISLPMFIKIFLTSIYISIIFLLQYFLNFLNAKNDEKHTVLFTLFVMFQLFNSFNCKEVGSRSIIKNLFKNKIMVIVVLITFILQIIFTQFLGSVFNTVPLSFMMWLKIILLSLSVIFISELIKFFIRLKNK